ncbi:SDR family oxidoreductase [Acinetobacter schindleri]|uniref:SDR family oxidoreductase n=1 Tax=Acinetobacter TaxID=469 RepID=UPI0008F544F1|nr:MULTISPECIES: SDR family oxidoreductase [Acinetobacter]OIJ39150.1 3-oxoacyl-ACP reductase [Acinetobacter sp. LCT-H3]
MQIRDQIVLVTGGARGLGLAISQLLIEKGARIVVNYLSSKTQAEALQKQYPDQVFTYQADVTQVDQVKALFGDNRPKVEDLSWEMMSHQFSGAVQACLNTTQAALEDMKQAHFGRIVNIGTNLVQNPVVPYHDYTTAKAALLAFTRTTAQDLGQYGINVNMLSGGLLQTTDASKATPDFVFDLIAQSTPLRRVITPEEFASAILMFLSPYSRAVTGQNLIVDGGLVKG